MRKISVSVLTADLGELYSQVEAIKSADYLHIDVMDGNFVPNITFGSDFVRCLRARSDLVFDVHLMVSNPAKHVETFAQAGADVISFHIEAEKDVSQVAKAIKKCGKRAGICVNTSTSLDEVADNLAGFDSLTIMSVVTGVGGQKYIESSTDKIRKARALIDARGYKVEISVDGGINRNNIKLISLAGADVFVVGSEIYKTGDPEVAIRLLRESLA